MSENESYKTKNKYNKYWKDKKANTNKQEQIVQENKIENVEICEPVAIGETFVIENEKGEEKISTKFGVVVNCFRVRVREQPKPDGKVLCEIDCLTNVMVDLKESTEKFYKIFTDSGIDGFCVKDYIALKK